MNKEIQLLYASLAQEDKAMVDAQIRELFVKRSKLLADKSCPDNQQQKISHTG